jgi:uncharacterized protein
MPSLPTTEVSPVSGTPLSKKDRILFLDAVRGIAVLGILFVNITAQGQSHFFYNHLNLNQPITGPNFYAWAIEIGLFEGNMRGLFSILFGVSTLLLINRLEAKWGAKEAGRIYYRRILWLLVFGLVNAYLFLWPGDVLYTYAVCALVLFPFRNSTIKIMVLCIAMMLALGFYHSERSLYHKRIFLNNIKEDTLLEHHHKKLTAQEEADLKAWKETQISNEPQTMMKKGLAETAMVQKADYWRLFVVYGKDLMLRQTIGLYYSWPDIMIFFFIGMILYKSGYITGEKSNNLYALVAFVGISIGIVISYWVLKNQYDSRFNATTDFESYPFDLYIIRRIFQTLGYLSFLILLYKITPLKRIFHLFIAVGQMAFTNYLSQSIITSIIFYGFGLYGRFQRYELYYFMVGIWIFQVIFCNIWLKYFLFGPFEWVWRSLTYRKIQPFKKVRENIPVEQISGTVSNL